MHLFAPMGKTPPILNFFGMMAGTTRLELATSAVTKWFYNLQARGDCKMQRKSHKPTRIASWVVG